MSPMRILIVEDDVEAAQYLVKAFRESGHVADSARDGLEGYDMARDETYDVLIVDRMLPRMDGLSLIGGLRAQKVTTPVLILSALGQVDDRVKGLRAGRRRLPAQALRLLRAARPHRGARRAARPPATARRPSTRSAAWSSTVLRTSCRATARRSRCSRASSGCSSTS